MGRWFGGDMILARQPAASTAVISGPTPSPNVRSLRRTGRGCCGAVTASF